MERKPEAPDFLDLASAHERRRPTAYRNTAGARYLQPEIVSAKG